MVVGRWLLSEASWWHIVVHGLTSPLPGSILVINPFLPLAGSLFVGRTARRGSMLGSLRALVLNLGDCGLHLAH